MAGHGPERVEHPRVLDAALDQVPLDHPVSGPRGRVVALSRFLGLGHIGVLRLILSPRSRNQDRTCCDGQAYTHRNGNRIVMADPPFDHETRGRAGSSARARWPFYHTTFSPYSISRAFRLDGKIRPTYDSPTWRRCTLLRSRTIEWQPSANAPVPARRSRREGSASSAAGPSGPKAGAEARHDVLVACPDARTPAYQAVVGLARAGRLGRFVTAFYYAGDGLLSGVARRLAPQGFARCERLLRRRHEPEIPPRRVRSDWGFDLALAAERRSRPATPRSGCGSPDGGPDGSTGSSNGRWFATVPARPCFSATSPRSSPCPRAGGSALPSVLSMVHGDVREERRVMEVEAETAPDFFPIYLGSGEVDPREMAWLHERRLRDIELADRILVPSEHIAGELVRHGTPRDRIAVVPYAADTRRFVPDPGKTHGASCTFLFAGGSRSARGSSTCWKPGGWSGGRAGGFNCWVPCRPTPARWLRTSTRSNGWAGCRMPRCPPGWRRPTSSSSRRSSRGRPS